MTFVDTFAEIADERRGLAALLSGLTGEQQATQSLCREWSVHDVVAHLVVPLEVGIPKFVLAMVACRGNFDRANVRLTREQARRPFGELTEVLRRKADSRFTPPGAGPEAPLTDLLVHGLDIRWPLGLPRDIPQERLHTSLTYLTAAPAGGVVPKGTLDGLRWEASDIDWSHGSGPTVRGDAEALLLAITGRTVALRHLSGDGLSTLRGRLA
ncbi:maleylpyruvate isomerase family mycothiol-dependent enzyme [Blastococcus sp. CT_GayMR20]|nr:maleylpyruvate isomerase family mycothiol-dependent enzyme [Blastococcus sp. CT_GayMR20]TFV92510.1 maleylpyruvate isomerase family mycothiol-dependent enzyme [Blastococcus sp. CT_GayMR20]